MNRQVDDRPDHRADHRIDDRVEELMASWLAAGEDVVLVDPESRHRPADGPGDPAEDAPELTGPAPTEPVEVERILRRNGRLVLRLDPDDGVSGLARALVAVQVLRTWTGHPSWIVLEDAQDLLADPDLPPEGLRLDDGGYCLVRRRSGSGTCTILPPRTCSRTHPRTSPGPHR